MKLPPHVIARPRRDGTFNVMFRVRKDRPEAWPSSILLPFEGRRGRIDDPAEFARIVADAATLTARLAEARRVPTPEDATLADVAAMWQAETWGEMRERTRLSYRKALRPALAWGEARKLRSLTLPLLLAFLDEYRDRPARQRAIRATLSAIFTFARAKGLIEHHPFGVVVRMRRGTRKREVELWDAEIVRLYADTADRQGWPGIANLIWLMWETSADQTDVVTWRRGVEFVDGQEPVITYTRGKTGERATVPISPALAERLRSTGEFLVADPTGEPYRGESAKDDDRRSRHFQRLRSIVVEIIGGPYRVLDHLRHSAVTDALASGARMEDVPSLTAHRSAGMARRIYSQMTATQARAVQQARGIVK